MIDTKITRFLDANDVDCRILSHTELVFTVKAMPVQT